MATIGSSMEKRLDKLITDLRATLADNLSSIVLYGSAARGDYAGAASDLNVMVVVRMDSPAMLEPASAIQSAWIKEGNRHLLFVTPEWIRGATDVFPMEFLDLLEARRVLWGPEPLENVSVSPSKLRLQCEREIRTTLLRLRTSYLDVHVRPQGLLELISGSYGTVAAIARAALRLAGDPVPARTDEMLDAAARRFGLDGESLRDAAEIKRTARAEGLPRMKSAFLAWFAQVEALGRALDTMKTGRGSMTGSAPGPEEGLNHG
jgi:hypothetical protein